jgi:polar amino acid transport system substrate-binding protein
MRLPLVGGLLLWMASCGNGWAAEVIAVDAADAPFMYAAGDQAAGIYPMLIAEAYRRIGEPVIVTAMPWKRALDGADTGVNGVAGLYKTAGRIAKYDYSDKLLDETLLIYVRKGHGFPYQTLADLKGRSVGVIRGWSYGDDFDAARKSGQFTVEEASGDDQNFAILDVGHIDCIISIREAAAAAIATHGWDDRFEQLPVPLSSNASYVAFAKSAGKQDELARFDAALAAMRADGTFQRLTEAALTQ